MADFRVFSVGRLIADSTTFYGVGSYVAVGAFYGHATDESMTVEAGRAIIEAWLGSAIPTPTPPEPGQTTHIGDWREPVASPDLLPTISNGDGDVRAAMSDRSLHIWIDATQTWEPLVTGGGGGGGGTPPPSTTPQNLFVQQTEPDVAALLVDTLWIPTNPDGTAKTPDFWEVYTGNTGGGDGSNLFVQRSAPTPVVDALWVPTNLDGTAKYLDDWQVITGRGSLAGVGNATLAIGRTLPTGVPNGTLFIPLNASEQALSYDQWRVYA